MDDEEVEDKIREVKQEGKKVKFSKRNSIAYVFCVSFYLFSCALLFPSIRAWI